MSLPYECPRCGTIYVQQSCPRCGFGQEEGDLSARDVVKPGDTVFITYYELKHTPAIVRSVMNRREGILSVRILPKDVPGSAYQLDPRDGMIALVVKGEEWELGRG